MKKQLIMGVLCLAATAANAEGWYAGVQFSNFDAELEVPGATADTEPDAVNLFIGKRVSKYHGFEGVLGRGIGDDEIENTSFDFEVSSIASVAVVGTLPIGDVFRAYAKFGLAHIRYDDSDGDEGDASGFMSGLGVALDVTEQFGLNLEYIKYPDGDYDDFDINVKADTYNIGAYIRF